MAKVRSEERTEFLYGLLVAAVEGGINYWAEVRNYKALDIPEAEASVEIHDLEDETNTWHKVTLDTVARGINALADGKVTEATRPMDPVYVRWYRGMNESNDADGIADAGVADCVIQAALLGDIVYG